MHLLYLRITVHESGRAISDRKEVLPFIIWLYCFVDNIVRAISCNNKIQ